MPGARVPFVDLSLQHEPLRQEINAAIGRVIDRNDFILGGAVRAFEEEFARYCGASHAVGVSSGTAALELLLRAYGIGVGDEVVVPASTFYATAYAVVATGARPVLVDCETATANIDPWLTARAITSNTRAILAVHLYGRPANMQALGQLARERGLLLLEDACQAHGARHNGRRAGTLGDGAAFSFYPGKNLGAFGDGGMVVTDNPEVAEQVRLLRDFGQGTKYHHETLGTNARLDTIQAAVLRIKLPHLDVWNQQRAVAAARYDELLSELSLVLPAPSSPAENVFHLYVIRARARDSVRAHLAAAGVDTGLHYPVPLHRLEAFGYLGYQAGQFAAAEAWAAEGLSLPMFPGITPEQQQHVAASLAEALAASPV